VKNEASYPLYVYWVNPNREYIQMGTVKRTKQEIYNSYEGHNFLITSFPLQEVLSTHSLEDSFAHSTVLKFTKGLYDEILTIFDHPTEESRNSLEMIVQSPYRDYEQLISRALVECGYIDPSTLLLPQADLTPGMRECFSHRAFTSIPALLHEKQSLVAMRENMAPRLRNYTCADTALTTSPSLSIKNESIDGQEYILHTLFQQESAQIFLIPSFLTPKECEVLVESSRNKLERAAVVGENGMAVISESRRAQQAAYRMSGEDDPLW
jgi:hypothetical protein